jgi:threonine dehydrogenase-like Zn-dependent dehydrogenase
MGRVVQLDKPRTVTVAAYDDEEPAAGEVRLQTMYSGISAGTELTQYRGSNPHLGRQWNSADRLFVDGAPTTSYPFSAWGYQEVGRVDAIGPGVDGLVPGQLVWGAWQHRSSAVVAASWAAEHRLPPEVPVRQAVFVRIGAIALNAVLDADVHLGENVAVFGLGVPGLHPCTGDCGRSRGETPGMCRRARGRRPR